MIKRSTIQVDDGKRYVSVRMATFCGLASLALVLVLTVVALGRGHDDQGARIEKWSEEDDKNTGITVIINLKNRGRFLVVDDDERPFSKSLVDEIFPEGGIQSRNEVHFILRVEKGTRAQAIVRTLDELKAKGFSRFYISG